MSIIEELPELSGLDPRGLAQLARAALRRLGDAPLWPLTDAEVLELVREIGATLAAGESARFVAVREVDTRGAAIAAGSPSTAAWLKAELRERPASASRSVAVARGLAESYPATAAALADGSISADHAQVICRVLDRLPATIPPGEVAEAEQTLLAHAAVYDPWTLAKLGEHLAYVVDPDGDKALAAYEARQEAGRELFLSQLDNGYWELRGRLGPVAGAQLWTILDSLSAPRPSTAEGPDPRTAAQRRADALAEACELLLDSEELPTQGGSGTTLIVTTTVETLEGRLGGPAASLPGGAPISIGSLRLPGLRRQGHRDDAGRRLPAARRGPYSSHRAPAPAARDARPRRPSLRDPWLWCPAEGRSPHRAVGEPRRDRARQPRFPVRLAPPLDPPRA